MSREKSKKLLPQEIAGQARNEGPLPLSGGVGGGLLPRGELEGRLYSRVVLLEQQPVIVNVNVIVLRRGLG